MTTSPSTPQAPRSVVISLDFEMRWGMHARLRFDFEAYRANLENARVVVPALLKLLAERSLRATWACVGALGCAGWEEYFRRAPPPPKYENAALAFNPRYAEADPEGRLHFAPELLETIRKFPGQELGTLTFSHLCMGERGVTAEDVARDLEAVRRLWTERYGGPPQSLVFPRNQVGFLGVVRQRGIRIWRGNPARWWYAPRRATFARWASRGLRLADSLVPATRLAARPEGDMTRASLFLRVNLPQAAWWLHRGRIRRELDGMRDGEIFHVYWHPHNLGGNVAASLARVEEILDLFAERSEHGQLASRNMADLAVQPTLL